MIRFVLLEVEEQNTVSLAIKNVVPVNSKLQIASARKCTVLVGSEEATHMLVARP